MLGLKCFLSYDLYIRYNIPVFTGKSKNFHVLPLALLRRSFREMLFFTEKRMRTGTVKKTRAEGRPGKGKRY